MTKHLWCWGDIISPELAEKALCAEAERDKARTGRHGSVSNPTPDPVPA